MKLPSLPEQPKNPHRPDDVLPSPIATPLQTFDVQDLQNQITFTDASLLPRVMRIVKITIAPNSATNEYRHQAVLYAQGVHIAVEWFARQRYDQLTCNGLVTIAYKGIKPISIDGYLQIIRLCRLDRPDMSYNLFETAPPDWFINKDILNRAIQAWEQLDDKNQHLLNAICFEGDFFKRFCTGPSSVSHHHSYPIAQKIPRAHGVVRDMFLRCLLLQPDLFYQAGKTNQISKLYLADANLAQIRFWLRMLVTPKLKCMTNHQHQVALIKLAEVGQILGSWIIKVRKG